MLGIPSSHVLDDLAFVPHSWLRAVSSRRQDDHNRGVSLPQLEAFPSHPVLADEDIQAILARSEIPKDAGDWTIVRLNTFSRSSKMVLPLPKWSTQQENPEDLSFSQVLGYVSNSNFINQWKDAFKKFNPSTYIGSITHNSAASSFGCEHDVVLLEILSRIYSDCPKIFHACGPIRQIQEHSSGSEPISRAYCIVIEEDVITVVRPFDKFSLFHAQNFSPAFIIDPPTKPSFFLYQILANLREIHSRGLSSGDVTLQDIRVTSQGLISIEPRPLASLVPVSAPDFSSASVQSLSDRASALLSAFQKVAKSKLKSDLIDQDSLPKDMLDEAMNLWIEGDISNFDYLMILNHLAGRTMSNPDHYAVMPWVRDFSSPYGGWRDLAKSKFRLNKGDAQLDLTYESLMDMNSSGQNTSLNETSLSVMSATQEASVQPAHHVTEVLSEITYYVYKARQSSKSVLCKHVRNRWVPAEYPSSMQRLQEWTPDEAIPEFFTDPQIFKSCHEDLPDLEVPDWCASPEEFIQWHRKALESPQVSEKLHQWIDLTFGYKLSGGSAIRAKNVCLNLVDNHLDLRTHGVVQLFTQAHPLSEEGQQLLEQEGTQG